MPKVSLIIPVYNMEHFLVRCLECAIHQTLKEIEIIVVNDGSTDGSLDIIEKYESKDNRIVKINQENQGLSESRNNAIKVANSEYLFFLDSDDDMDINTLESFYTTAVKYKSDIVVARGRVVKSTGITELDFPILKDNDMDNILNTRFGVSAWSKLFKKNLFMDNNICFPKGQYYEDHITTTKLFFHANSINYMQETFYNYYKHDSSITSSISRKKVDDVFQVAIDLESFLKEVNLFFRYKNNIFQKLIKLLNNYILKNLLVKDDSNVFDYLINKINDKKSSFSINLQELKYTNISLYIYFIINIIKLSHKYANNNIDFLLRNIDKEILEIIKKNIDCKDNVILSTILYHLIKKQGLTKIVVYGGGSIFLELSEILNKNGIEIVAVIDKNKKLIQDSRYDYFTISEWFDSHINVTQYPVVITSLAYIDDIRVELETVANDKKCHSLNLVDLHSI